MYISVYNRCSLKTQQGLLVDFGAFPRKFIDLLELCLQEKDRDNPKYLMFHHKRAISTNI